MSDLNKEALDVWGALKPMIDQEISSRTQGMVQRRKAKVTTAPSLATNTIGVTEAFGPEIFLPFVSNMISAKVGDFVWIEWMYGATNAFVSSFAAVDDKNITVAGTLDVVQRRCYATLSSEGWYRVCKIASIGRGDYSFAIDLNICRQFYYTNNEQHGIKLIANWDSYSFVNEDSKSNTQIITKVRYTRDGNDNGYIDIYYDSSLQNDVYCEFAAHGFYPSLYTIESLQAVAASPSGETVLTTYEFTANGIRTVTLTSAHSSVTINNQKAVRSGKVVSLWVDFTVSTSISGYGYLINTPTFATAANALVYDLGNTVQTNVRLYADEGNYGLRCYIAFPAGRYIAFITYITTDV